MIHDYVNCLSLAANDVAFDPTSFNLLSSGGVVATSFILTEVVKRLVRPTTPILGRMPIVFVPLILCSVLVVLANKVFMKNDGSPFLVGNLWSLLGTSLMTAASSSGFYTWIKNGGVTTGEAQPIGGPSSTEDYTMKPNPCILIALLMFMTGCTACPEKAVIRETMYQGSRTAWNDVKKWGEKLVVYPPGTVDPRTGQPSDGKNKASDIKLSPLAYQELLKTSQDYENTVAEDRKKDQPNK